MKKLIEIVKQFLGLGATSKAIITATQLNEEVKEAIVEVKEKVEEVKETVKKKKPSKPKSKPTAKTIVEEKPKKGRKPKQQ
jgi:hypothetical protein